MATDIIIATTNKGKIKEFKQLFEGNERVIKSLLDYPHIMDIPEDGHTFHENAAIKAETLAGILNCTVIADDSGLEVDALNGAPGIYSARYAGEQKNDAANIEKLLKELEGTPEEKRTARFVCVIAVAQPGEETIYFKGQFDGIITSQPQGEKGFGYDPIFYIPELGQTAAEISSNEKNARSHRGKAIQELLKYKNLFNL
ncbi:XTP/dITP diphosphatase [Alkalicoccobacillus porphyridii]|uniref:dITP/XTP pyrophosphatase n=1 Tax=Alkalicoccobacillus porphyridii TaxID=2597270 RepID=A0A554A2R1_9BACI|nr:XTP/dITP diphosphatase [Alkalicoccobacillus porphyridii]TSB47980.1 XTP/dITP diphosphatase [Alkalicoccobacillus porphyridii]